MTASQSPDNFTAPPTWPKRPARLGTAVVDVLVDRIVSGELEPGSLLPTEPRLSEAFSVSRTVIREAVKILEQKGLVRARQGQGTRVALPDEWNLLDPMVLEASVRHDKDLRILDDLVEVRRVLEAEMAREAAMKAPDTVVGPDDERADPAAPVKTDYEVELAVVLGATARYLTRPDDGARMRRRVRDQQRRERAGVPDRAGRPVGQGQELRDVQPVRAVDRDRR